jgi:ribosomal protein L24E
MKKTGEFCIYNCVGGNGQLYVLKNDYVIRYQDVQV